jgi:ABC-type uncharacterized transport system substrate-binding protein
MPSWLGFAAARAAVTAALALLGIAAAQAHPHVWITARSELVFGPDGVLTEVRHAWTFDEATSSQQVMGIDGKTKGQFTREELASKADDSMEGLKEFRYFTYAKADGSKIKFGAPMNYYLEYKNELVTLYFTLPLKAPLKSRDLSVEVYDPTYFIDFAFEEKEPVKLVGAPSGCELQFKPPNDASADAQRMNEQNFMNGDNSNYGAMYATKILVKCP